MSEHKGIRIRLADGIERILIFDLNALQKVYETTGENPIDPTFWTAPTGKYENDEAGKTLYFDTEGHLADDWKTGRPRQIMRNNLTPAKIRVLIWAGLDDPALDIDKVGKLITLGNLAEVTNALFQIFTVDSETKAEEHADPFVSSAPSA